MDAQVKWFDPAKGYGFLMTARGDVFVTRDVLRSSGLMAIDTGSRLDIAIEETPKGLRATHVEPSEQATRRCGCRAIVKWFNPRKGYGFLSVNGQEAFIHAATVRACGIISLSPGDVLAADIEIVNGRYRAVRVSPRKAREK